MSIKHIVTASWPAVLVLLVSPAWAADADWISPASEGVTSLTTSLVTIAGGLIGLSIVCAGIWAAMTQRIEWQRIWIFFVAGLLVTVGPTAITWFIALMQKSSS